MSVSGGVFLLLRGRRKGEVDRGVMELAAAALYPSGPVPVVVAVVAVMLGATVTLPAGDILVKKNGRYLLCDCMR